MPALLPLLCSAATVCAYSVGTKPHRLTYTGASASSLPCAAVKFQRTFTLQACAPAMAVSTSQVADDAFGERKEALIAGLRKEYDAFFQPMETQLYSKDVTFKDPLISFQGVEKYKQNVDMLAGVNAVGRTCFSDCALIMHNVTSDSRLHLRTRWTLQFRFKLLPWRPLAQFTGVSEYTLDEDARVTSQVDFWDSVNMQQGGSYELKPAPAAFFDLLKQLTPQDSAQAASGKELPYVLLRRTDDYEVRRYPQNVAVNTEYERRIDAFGALGAYTNGANELGEEVQPFVPSLMSIPQEGSEKSKLMRWPMLVPSIQRGEAAPPQPAERLQDYVSLELVPSKVVAVLSFSDPTTETITRGYGRMLRSFLARDGLGALPAENEELQLAQYDALNSFKTRRSEVWVELAEHPW